jgi:BirA family biotin operon repressor/biotin-[acetyl-CoA-carboxylase] ligase
MLKKDDNKNERNAQAKSKQDMHLAKQIHFEQIDSTNTWAKKHPDQWASTGVTLITASEQTAGRGRFKRLWISPPHLNIYATFCFWNDLQRSDMGHIPQLLAIAAAQTLEKQGFSPTIKWPNDVLLQQKKVGGILCETIIEQERQGIICGIGLNVNMPLEILKQIDRPATSLLVEGGHPFEVSHILDVLQQFFLAALNQFIAEGFAPFFPLFHQRSALKKGQLVRFHDHQTLIEAQFEKLHPNGSVELRLIDGNSKIFYAGEFLHFDTHESMI